MRRTLFLVIIFCNAFLLFQVQPILSKEMLPIFGGSASVWTASMLFFQSMLLCGYFYAHIVSKLHFKLQFAIHSSLLILAAAFTFTEPVLSFEQNWSPMLRVILILIQQVGIAFILLASTSVLLQQWHISTSNDVVPYHWYSLSNIGSLLALVSYPFLFEINFTVSTQKLYWLVAFSFIVILKLLLMTSLYHIFKSRSWIETREEDGTLEIGQVWLWVAFSATSSMMLVATTQMISINIPPMPLIWIVPLTIYLASFIYCFSSESAYQRAHWVSPLIFAVTAGIMMFFVGSQFNALTQLLMYSLILLICSVVCHGELRLKAPNGSSFTLFYLSIAAGSVVGCLFTALVAPILFDKVTEFVISIFLVLLLYSFAGKQISIRKQIGWAALISIFAVCYFSLEGLFNQHNVATKRNFYGYIAVKDIYDGDIAERRLIDGTTVHGTQPLTGKKQFRTSYYQKDSGVAIAFDYLKRVDSLNIGVIGLGAGVLADFSRIKDSISFYELNPAVYHMAKNYFSYLSNAEGEVGVTISDGRLALEERLKERQPLFDALVIDAFSSDVIPSHLLTQEALSLYWKNLREDGLLIIHISNNHIDLTPVLDAHSKHFDKQLIKFRKVGKLHKSFGSNWAILTNDQNFIASVFELGKFIRSDSSLTWTDERYSILPLIKF